jgi:hypothetical protein
MQKHSERFRVNTATLAILNPDGEHLPITVPTRAVLKVVKGPLDGNQLVDVNWEDKTLMMFATDLRERCIKLEEV